MKAVVVEKAGSVTVEQIPVPELQSGEVLVKVHAAGLCGSDFHIFNGTYPATYPIVQGHEFSGEITAVGPDVEGWHVGQRVTADPNIYCRHCYYCKKSQENMCENAQAIGVTRNGAFAEYVAVPQTQLYALPDSISYEEGALVEPLSCVLYGVKRLEMQQGDKAIIFGAGPMGMLLLKALKTGGASTLAMVDLDPVRLEQARKMGATETFTSVEEAVAAQSRGYDVVVDATGNPKVIEGMFRAAARRAKILQFGCADSNSKVVLNPYEIYDNDWKYIGTKTAVNTYSAAIDMMAAGRIDVKDLISQTVDMETLSDYLQHGKPAGTLKIVLQLLK